MTSPESHKNTPARRRRYDQVIVAALAVALVALWILSLAGVRARLATRAWERGDIERAYRLAAMATRQRPELADMWVLQAHCEERLESPCKAALSYARAVLAATEQAAQKRSTARAAGTLAADAPGSVRGGADLAELRDTALRQALASAATCESISTIATVFEALTVGLPSAPEERGGIWPGEPEVASGRETPESLSMVLPVDPELQLRWIDFLWRRQQAGVLGATTRLLSANEDLSAAGLWKLGSILLDSGDGDAAIQAFQMALRRDPEWIPAAAELRRLGADEGSGGGAGWREQPLPLEIAVVDAVVSEVRGNTLILATNGSVAFEIEAPAGTRRAFLVLDISGTAANGQFPEIGLLVDGTSRPSFEATENAFPVVVEIPSGTAGPVTVTFVFNNDWADSSGDRNVFFAVPTLYLSQ